MHPRRVGIEIDGDRSEFGEVEEEEGGFELGHVGEAFVVVAAASDSEVEVQGFGTEEGGLHVGVGGRREDEDWFRRRRHQVPEVLGGGIQNASEGGIGLGVYAGKEGEGSVVGIQGETLGEAFLDG